jgi:hypothetical protein
VVGWRVRQANAPKVALTCSGRQFYRHYQHPRLPLAFGFPIAMQQIVVRSLRERHHLDELNAALRTQSDAVDADESRETGSRRARTVEIGRMSEKYSPTI